MWHACGIIVTILLYHARIYPGGSYLAVVATKTGVEVEEEFSPVWRGEM